ncbi:MAG TPA: hypothetical protein VGG46_03855 [Terriglobales bacterium]|jgi:hypothetical protein
MMKPELLNLAFFAAAIVKVSFITGLTPMIFIFYAARTWANYERVPARKLPESWRVWVNPNPPAKGKKVA